VPLQRAAVATAKAELFKALAHPIRVRVLEVLVDGQRSVGELAAELDVEMSHLSQQLAILRRADVVTAERVRNTVLYSLRDPRMAQLLVTARQMLVSGLRDNQSLLSDLEDETPVRA
jgi:ArsR family transcriptional regulator